MICEESKVTSDISSFTWSISNIFLSVTIAPVEASLRLCVQCQNDEGAFIMADNPVSKHQIDDEGAAIEWVKTNAVGLLKEYKSVIDKHGLWVVTKTYTSRRCAVAVMSSRSSSAELGISADVPGVLTLTPSSEWLTSSTNSSFEIHEDEQGVVAFMSGIHFSKRLLRSKLKQADGQNEQRKKILRSGGALDLDQDDDQDSLDDHEDGVELFTCAAR